jgi:hypothetical protein
MRTRDKSSDQIGGATRAFAFRVHANQRAQQAEPLSRMACDGERPGGHQTGIVREGDVEAVETIDASVQVPRRARCNADRVYREHISELVVQVPRQRPWCLRGSSQAGSDGVAANSNLLPQAG